MEEKALKYFTEAWSRIKGGDFFDETNNNAFEYMLRSLWKTTHHKAIKQDILKHIPTLFAQLKLLESPPPYIYILISLKDPEINKLLITEGIVDLVKDNASEQTTYQILNLIQTMDEKGTPIDNFINAIINNLKPTMNKDMVEALAHMITIQHPEHMRKVLQKFLSFPDKTVLKNFVRMGGRVALLQLLHLTTPGEVQKLLK